MKVARNIGDSKEAVSVYDIDKVKQRWVPKGGCRGSVIDTSGRWIESYAALYFGLAHGKQPLSSSVHRRLIRYLNSS
jgi:hypothetical protein